MSKFEFQSVLNDQKLLSFNINAPKLIQNVKSTFLKVKESLTDLQFGNLSAKLLALFVSFLVYQLISFIVKRRKQRGTFKRMKIPESSSSFISGHLYESRRQPFVKFAEKLHKKYGQNVGIYLGGDPFLLTTDLDLIRQLFVSRSRNFYNRMFFYLNIDPVPDNLICMRGERWRYMRRLLTPFFTHSRLAKSASSFYKDTQATVVKFMRQVQKYKNNKSNVTLVADTYDRMAAVALDVIVKTAFHMDNAICFDQPLKVSMQAAGQVDKKPSTNQNNVDTFLETVKKASRIAFNPLVELIFCFPFLDSILTSLANQLYFNSILTLLLERLDYLIRRSDSSSSIDNIQQSKEYESSLKQKRIVDSLIEVFKTGAITRSEFTGNAFVIVFAGFETTANALTFTLWLLSQHQEKQKKLRLDLIDLMKSSDYESVADISEQILSKIASECQYLEAVINESLRLYPPVPGLSCRQAAGECQVPITSNSNSKGCEQETLLLIEKHVNVLPSVYSIHRDKTLWGSDANLFIPERFELLDPRQLNSPMFMPFGFGPRNCIGNKLAMHELKIVIALLILNYSIEHIDNSTPLELELSSPINITLTCANKIPMNFVELKNK